MFEVKVYSTANCHNCVSLKEYLNEKGIKFQECNAIERPHRAYLMSKAILSAPYIEVTHPNGFVDSMTGFDKEKLDVIFTNV